jgi:hypothetical protein
METTTKEWTNKNIREKDKWARPESSLYPIFVFKMNNLCRSHNDMVFFIPRSRATSP